MSLSERMKEHLEDARAFREGSHMVKHWMEHHPSLASLPAFRYRIIRSFKDCLTRQIHEAVKIHQSEDVLLNSKGEYISNSISRVTVDSDALNKRKKDMEDEAERQRLKNLEEFKKVKTIKGIKRSKRGSTHQANNTVQKRRRLDELPGKTRSLAIEYFPLEVTLAIEYFPKKMNPISARKLSPDPSRQPPMAKNACGAGLSTNIQEVPTAKKCEAGPPQVGGRISFTCPTEQLTIKDRSANYILNLFGWAAWWVRVTKVDSRHEKSGAFVDPHLKLTTAKKREKSEEEKKKFVKKFFRPTEGMAQRINGSAPKTPKRVRESEDNLNGESSNGNKKFKEIILKERVWKTTELLNFNENYTHLNTRTDLEDLPETLTNGDGGG